VCLTAKALLEDWVAGEVSGQDLECDDSVGEGVVRPENLAHSAPTEQFQQLIVPERRRIQVLLLDASELH
jgi:hypothetical protein